MEGGALFDQGFLGSKFLWWIGQVADDSTWRDNIPPGKFSESGTIKGWGRRYKVRIMGLHDADEEVLPSDQLPWANVMYPVTAGGGQASAWQTPNIRQGMFVFGFFMDGQDQQQPIIMGVLGNNEQTSLKTATSISPGFSPRDVKPFEPISGYAQRLIDLGNAKEFAPKTDLVTEKPKTPEQKQESAPSPPGTKKDKYGMRLDLKPTKAMLADKASGMAAAAQAGLSGAAETDFVANAIAGGLRNRVLAANSPGSPAQPGATMESSGNSIHQTSADGIQFDDKLIEKVVLLKPGNNEVDSAIKAIQTTIDNTTKKIDKFMQSQQSYADAVSSDIDIDKVMKESAKEVAKFTKIIYNKQMEYQAKVLNSELTSVVAELPLADRFKFADIKDLQGIERNKLFSGMTNALEGQMGGILGNAFNLPGLLQQAQAKARDLLPDNISSEALNAISQNYYIVSDTGGEITGDTPYVSALNVDEALSLAKQKSRLAKDDDGATITVVDKVTLKKTSRIASSITSTSAKKGPKVPICYAEDIVAQSLSMNKDKIDKHNKAMAENIGRFVNDVTSELNELQAEIKPTAYDATKEGAVVDITQFTWGQDDYGGDSYVTGTNVPTTIGVSTISSGPGTGTGLTVDITVGVGSIHTPNSHDAKNYTEILNGGSGYSAALNVATTGGSGTGCKVNTTVSGGAVTGIAITTPTVGSNHGSGYKDGDVLTITGGGGNATFRAVRVKGAVTEVVVRDPGHGYDIDEEIVISQGGGSTGSKFSVSNIDKPSLIANTAQPPNVPDLGSLISKISNMGGNLTAAFGFINGASNMFPFELPPLEAIADYYQLGTGGGTEGQAAKPSFPGVDMAMKTVDDVSKQPLPFVQPQADITPNLPLNKPITKSDQNKASAQKQAEADDFEFEMF